MKIVIVSRQFYPILGGVPVVADLLAKGIRENGHEVTTITATPEGDTPDGRIGIMRNPSPGDTLKVVRAADGVFSVGVSLRSAWYVPLLGKRHVISHQAGELTSRMKVAYAKTARNVACSQWLADRLAPVPATAIGNAYDDTKFFRQADATRDLDFVFCGRITKDKGIFDLLQAMRIIVGARPDATLTLIGAGDAMEQAQDYVTENGLTKSIQFLGRQTHAEIAEVCNAHKVGVVPSKWQEPFGIVALELAACGLRVVGARSGGLPEAIGPNGDIHEIGDAEDMARKMMLALEQWTPKTPAEGIDQDHITFHTPKRVAQRYLNVLMG